MLLPVLLGHRASVPLHAPSLETKVSFAVGGQEVEEYVVDALTRACVKRGPEVFHRLKNRLVPFVNALKTLI